MVFIASKFLEKYLEKLQKNDLVLIFISGGGSALAPYPVDGVSLRRKNHYEQNSFRVWSKY